MEPAAAEPLSTASPAPAQPAPATPDSGTPGGSGARADASARPDAGPGGGSGARADAAPGGGSGAQADAAPGGGSGAQADSGALGGSEVAQGSGSDMVDALSVPVATGVPVAEPAPASPRLTKREGRSPRDMGLSLLVLIVPIALLLLFYRVVLDGDEPLTVDPTSSIQLASKDFTVLTPTGLDADWRVTAATFKRETGGATLRIGYVGPGDDPVQLVESTVPADKLVPAEVGNEGKRIGAYRTDARSWLVYSGRPDETTLIFTEGTRTVLLIGKTEQQNLEALAGSLK
ncbi:DUF4245 family protein [Actinoplanes sp. NPDC020271]|uniref:DUF4245 domain-containing protein n=1 Tax=Actinoplanes sp. NPDC020271 TaxID=3363896 RepID=UPI0037A20849